MSEIRFSSVWKSFEEQQVLGDFTLEVKPGEIVGLMGASGCGKTTVLNLAAGLIKPDGGSVTDLGTKRLTYLFAENRLILHKSGVANLLNVMKTPDESQAMKILKSLGLDGEALKRPVRELSFGMARRVAIARAMAHDGEVILYDEPVYGLDGETRRLVIERLKEHLMGKTGIVVTHEEDVASALCHRVLRL